MPALDHLLDDLRRLAGRRAPARRSIARSRSTSAGSTLVDVERQRVGRGDVHGDLLAERLQLRRVAGRLRAPTSTPILPRPGADRVVHVGGDHALRRPRARAGAAQRHVLADRGDQLLVSFSATVAAAGIRRALQRLDVAAAARARARATSRDEVLELLVPGDEVGLGVDLDAPRRACRRRRRRPGLRRRRGRPSWRPRRGPSCAASRRRLPCRRRSRPAPSCSPSCRRRCFSRSSLTSAAVISAMRHLLLSKSVVIGRA